MIPYADWLFYAEMAQALHALLFWTMWSNGTYQPLLMPVDDATWRQIMQ